MFASALRFVILHLLKVFYPRIEVRGRTHIAPSAPTIVVANHPNSLLDPLVLMIGLRQHLWFLAKSTFFANPVGNIMMNAFGALPIYRQADERMPGGAAGNRSDRNEATFARCRALLRRGKALALFPEGTTHSQSTLLPLRTGAARIALSAEAEANWQLKLQIVPTGLWYENKGRFRSSVLLVIGEPFSIASFADLYATDPFTAVDMLTDEIDRRLDRVVLQAENNDVLRAMPILAEWTAVETPLTLEALHARTDELLSGYRRILAVEPERIATIEHHARSYADSLQALGIDNPWKLEINQLHRGRVFQIGLFLLLGLVPAALGAAITYVPYRLVAPLTPLLMGRYDEMVGTGKVIIGTVLILVGWLIAGVVCGMVLGAWWGVALVVLAPLLAFLALRWGELWNEFRQITAITWLNASNAARVRSLAENRRALSDEVAAALADAQQLRDEEPENA